VRGIGTIRKKRRRRRDERGKRKEGEPT